MIIVLATAEPWLLGIMCLQCTTQYVGLDLENAFHKNAPAYVNVDCRARFII